MNRIWLPARSQFSFLSSYDTGVINIAILHCPVLDSIFIGDIPTGRPTMSAMVEIANTPAPRNKYSADTLGDLAAACTPAEWVQIVHRFGVRHPLTDFPGYFDCLQVRLQDIQRLRLTVRTTRV